MTSTSNSVSRAQIEALIVSEHYSTAFDGRQGAIENGTYVGREKPSPNDADLAPLKQVTICTLITKGGYKFVGVNMGAAVASNFDPDQGRHYAREAAIEQFWPALGYQVHRMFGGDWVFRAENEREDLTTRRAQLREDIKRFEPLVPEGMAEQLYHMDNYAAALQLRLDVYYTQVEKALADAEQEHAQT